MNVPNWIISLEHMSEICFTQLDNYIIGAYVEDIIFK